MPARETLSSFVAPRAEADAAANSNIRARDDGAADERIDGQGKTRDSDAILFILIRKILKLSSQMHQTRLEFFKNRRHPQKVKVCFLACPAAAEALTCLMKKLTNARSPE